MIVYAKFALHQPLNRQSEAYAREGVDLPQSTLADDVGTCAAVLAPLADLIGAPSVSSSAAKVSGRRNAARNSKSIRLPGWPESSWISRFRVRRGESRPTFHLGFHREG